MYALFTASNFSDRLIGSAACLTGQGVALASIHSRSAPCTSFPIISIIFSENGTSQLPGGRGNSLGLKAAWGHGSSRAEQRPDRESSWLSCAPDLRQVRQPSRRNYAQPVRYRQGRYAR